MAGDCASPLVLLSLPRSALSDAWGMACDVPDPDWINWTPMLLTLLFTFMRPTYGAAFNFPGAVPFGFK